MYEAREKLLHDWARRMIEAAAQGALTGGAANTLHIRHVDMIAGPRVGALEVDAGFDAARLMRVDPILLSQVVPWRFLGNLSVFRAGRYVRVEAGWSAELAETSISFADLAQHPQLRSGTCILGRNDLGETVTYSISDSAPHLLMSGATGSGKTWALRSMVTQWSSAGDRLVLLDGKGGEGLNGFQHLPGVVGPLAMDLEMARAALGWVYAEMMRRYAAGEIGERAQLLIVVIDEVQELAKDVAVREMVRRIAAQGRSARVSLAEATQKPVLAAMGGDRTVKTNLPGRIAMRVDTAESSKAALGQSEPRADWLLGAGDAYAVKPGVCHRIQIAYMPRKRIEALMAGNPVPGLSVWPEFDATVLGQEDVSYPSGKEVAISLALAAKTNGEGGRDRLEKMYRKAGLIEKRASAERLRRALRLGRDVLEELRGHGWDVCRQKMKAEG